MNEARLIDIETKLAFQEDAIQKLHDSIYEQQKQIERLEMTCKLLMDRLKEIALTEGGNKPAHEKPPHY